VTVIVEGAKVMAKGQITLPKDIRDRLSVGIGDRVVLIWDEDRVVMMNPALYAMRVLQREMAGRADGAGFASEEDVADYVTSQRREQTDG
jgi:AbrB family looped-hinge helix DNA binding protein